MNKDTLQKTKDLLTLVNDGLTKSDFTRAFQQVLQILRQREAQFNQALNKLEQTYAGVRSNLSQESKNLISKEIEKVSKDQALKSQKLQEQLALIHPLTISDIEPLIEEAKVEAIQEALSQVPKVDIPDLKPIIDSWEEKFKELEDELSRVKKTTRNGPVGTAFARGVVRAFNLNDYGPLDGVKKTFNTLAMWRVISITSSSFPTTFIENTDYTWTPTSITFTSQIDASTTLAAGQSIWVVYVVA